MEVSWLFPSCNTDSRVDASIAGALEALLDVSDLAELQQIIEGQAALLTSGYTLAALYLTSVRSAQAEETEVAQAVHQVFEVLGSARRVGGAETCRRLERLVEGGQEQLLTPLDYAELLGEVSASLERDDYPALQAMLSLELGDLQAQLFDETHEGVWLEQASAHYSTALALQTREENPALWQYLHMRRGIVALYRQAGVRAEIIEQAIADLEAALAVEPPEGDETLCAPINQRLGQAYSERVYAQRADNLRRATAAYRAYLDECAPETSLSERLTVLQALLALSIELREQQAARETLSAMQQVVQEMEREARERLEGEGGSPQAAVAVTPPDSAVLAAVLDEWLAIDERDQLYALLVQRQELLLSEEAQTRLRQLLTAPQTREQAGQAEHIQCLLRLLEEACTWSIDVAWPRYLQELLLAQEAILLPGLEDTFQGMERRVIEQRDLLSSPALLAVLYTQARASHDELEQQHIRQFIALLQHLRSSKDLPQLPGDPPQSDASEGSFVLKPEHLASIRLDDPYIRAVLQETRRLSPERAAQMLSVLQHIFGGSSTLSLAHLGPLAEEMLLWLDSEQMPYWWATLQVVCALRALDHPGGAQQQALRRCDAALAVLTGEATLARAWLLLVRAMLRMNSVLGEQSRGQHGEERRRICQQALEDLSLAEPHFVQHADPLFQALVRATRGMARAEESEATGLPAEDLARVLADFTAALPMIQSRGNLWQRLCVHLCRARVLYRSRAHDRQQAIALVLADCEAVITLTQAQPTQQMAEARATMLVIHGMACMERLDVSPGENAAQAIKDCTLALAIYTREAYPQDWAMTLVNRGNVLMRMAEGGLRENLEKALQDYHDALAVLQSGDDRKLVGQVLLNRSMCLLQRVAGERTQNQRRALEDCHEALAIFRETGQRHEEASVLINRAGIYLLLLSGDRQTNMHLAEADCGAALDLVTRDEAPQEWAKALANRGIARRSLAGSVGHVQRSGGVRTMLQRVLAQHPASVLAALADARQLYERSLEDFSGALTVLTRASHPFEWARVVRERALTWSLAALGAPEGEREAALRRGIFDFECALAVFTPRETPYDWAITTSNRAVLYLELATKERLDDAAHALADTEAAQTVLTRQVAPAHYCRLQFMRAELFCKLEQWSQAHAALLSVREVQRDLVASAPGSQEQQDVVAEFSLADLYVRAAWVLAQIQPVDTAAMAIALEEGRGLAARMAFDLDTMSLDPVPSPEARARMTDFLKARNHWRKLQHRALFQPDTHRPQELYAAYHVYQRARTRIREHDNPDFMTPVPTMEQIGRALSAPDEALVYLVAGSFISEAGGMALLVTRDSEQGPQARLIPLPGLHEIRVLDLLDSEPGQTPRVRIDEALADLGEQGLNEVVMHLRRQRIEKVRLVPYGWLGLFPWPALQVTTADGRRHHLSDLFAEVSIVPGARSLELSRQGARSRLRHTLLLAGNPEPHPPQEDLPFALAEASAVRRIARTHGYREEHIHYLAPPQVTRTRVIDELASARYAHLALHAQYCAGDPRRSRLLLADTGGRETRSISLGEVLDGRVDVRGMRLLVLSACETSVIDMQRVPNEALGLAAGFVQAGACAVIASLWPVEDAPTFLLMTRFARVYLDRQEPCSAAGALAAAARWLRSEATNRVLATYDPAFTMGTDARLRSLTFGEARRKIQKQAAAQVREGAEEVLPYAAAYYWAGFVVVGV